MGLDVKLPDLGEGVASGDVLRVLVREGDVIKKNQSVLELETDKATVEVPSSHAGRVVKVHVAGGQTISVGDSLLTVEAEVAAAGAEAGPTTPVATKGLAPSAEGADEIPDDYRPVPPTRPAAELGKGSGPSAPVAKPITTTKKASPASSPAPPAPIETSVHKSTHVHAVAEGEDRGDVGSIPAGPSVRRFAREVGIDLATVQGTGPHGRISREDVLRAVRQLQGAASSAVAEPPVKERPAAGVKPVAPADPTADSAIGLRAHDDWGPVRLEPMTRIRKTIATRMQQSWSTVPRVTNFDDADVTELERIRQASKDDYAAAGIKLTALPFIIKAVAMALRQHPLLNATIDLEEEQIIFKEYIHIGVAVDTDRGLIVPSLRDADDKSIAEIARELARIADNARDNRFSLEDLRGSSFTISNLGAVGGTYSTPIINPPEVAILLVGRARQLPVVRDDAVVVRLIMPLSISYDHRLVDGAAASRFMNDLIGYLGAPSRLLLAP